MTDSYGMPIEQRLGILWRDLDRRIGILGSLFWILATLVALLVITLVQKGVLSGWSDLVRDVTPK